MLRGLCRDLSSSFLGVIEVEWWFFYFLLDRTILLEYRMDLYLFVFRFRNYRS
jgi:hypothetical protein